MDRSHSMPFGAELQADGSTRFRLWAPAAKHIELILLEDHGRSALSLKCLPGGWFELETNAAKAGSLYRFRIDGKTEVPDPASRFQPQDVHGPSEVIDPNGFDWRDAHWRGRAWEETVIYELHVGTFTPEGSFRGVEEKLDYLKELGITAIELMPVADFPGSRNWGYDGVLPYAPDSSYGRPDDLKRLVQSAHGKGLMIFLDVVYNHFGPVGNYLHLYSPQFFTDRHHTPWGDAINFDGPNSHVVREFFIHNALYWLEEYHFDGLRLDAVHAILDDSNPDILTELAKVVRQRLGKERSIHLVLENADNSSRYLQRDANRKVQLYNAQWNDDLHHAAHVVVTGESDGYYSDYVKDPVKHLCRCLTEGFAYQGEYSEFHSSVRGEPSAKLPPTAFVSFLQNHDQIGNRAFGERILQLAQAQAVKAAMEILLLAPEPPLMFMGEEFAADSPFLFFCDFQGDLAAAVTNGRRNEFARFAKFSSAEIRDSIPDPNAKATFQKSKLDWESISNPAHDQWLKLYRKLLYIRQKTVVPLLSQTSKSRCQTFNCIGRRLAVDWSFANGAQLELRANLGYTPIERLPASGRPFYATNSEEVSGTQFPAWSVVWSLL